MTLFFVGITSLSNSDRRTEIEMVSIVDHSKGASHVEVWA